MSRIAVITGAGSGVGQAVARILFAAGWKLALVARRAQTLDASLGLPCPCDVSDEKQVQQMVRLVVERLGTPTVLVNNAGTNIPHRGIEQLTTDDFRELVNVNLTGAFYCIHALLPMMRAAGAGTIINIASDAAITANARAGAAYIASKFGLRGLTHSINAEQRMHGIRACAICPGDIDTPLLNRRPNPPTDEARKRMLQPDDVARCVMLAIDLPQRAVIEELLIRPA